MDLPSRHIQAAGWRIRIRQLPSAPGHAKAPLVFLHEGLGCIEMWRDFPQRLCALTGRAGLLYDRRGYGSSDALSGRWPYDYLVQEAGIFLPEVLDACGIDRAVLVGHSDGGSIALLTAALHRSRVCAAVTEAAHVLVEEVTLAGIRRTVTAYASTDLKTRLAFYHGDNTESVFRRWADTWLAADFQPWNIEVYLPRVTCPLLILQGRDDEYATADQVRRIAAGVSGPAKVALLPDCGHIPHFQATEAALAEMVPFIQNLEC
jgi:pimeloyl-ACP methyl ester carboxylesterase